MNSSESSVCFQHKKLGPFRRLPFHSSGHSDAATRSSEGPGRSISLLARGGSEAAQDADGINDHRRNSGQHPSLTDKCESELQLRLPAVGAADSRCLDKSTERALDGTRKMQNQLPEVQLQWMEEREVVRSLHQACQDKDMQIQKLQAILQTSMWTRSRDSLLSWKLNVTPLAFQQDVLLPLM